MGRQNSMKFPLRKAQAPLVMAVIVAFLLSFFIAYFAMTLLPGAYYEQRVYSVHPSLDHPTKGSSSVGGEAFTGEFPVQVIVGPAPGDMNVSRDTIIYVLETRPVAVDLHLTPETPIARTTKEDGQDFPSESTTLYPAELLKPDITYNVSGTIMGLSAWWTFTTGLEPEQPRMECILSPNVWWIAIAAAVAATLAVSITLWTGKRLISIISSVICCLSFLFRWLSNKM
jgi:hypothetical protein